MGGVTEGTDTSDASATADDILLGETAYARGEKITGTIPLKEEATYTPTTEDQTIEAGKYLNGNQIIKGDPNLLAENIKKGVSIFGVDGEVEDGKSMSNISFFSGGGIWTNTVRHGGLGVVWVDENEEIQYSGFGFGQGGNKSVEGKVSAKAGQKLTYSISSCVTFYLNGSPISGTGSVDYESNTVVSFKIVGSGNIGPSSFTAIIK